MTKEQIQEFTLRTSQENHSGLILVLCDIVGVYTEDAIEAYDNHDLEVYLRNMELAKRTQNELIDCFNPTDKQGREVISVLRYIYRCFVTATVKRNPHNINECMGLLAKLRVGFEHLHEIDTDGPVMRNTHQVYAGLTYGKGVLNESTIGVDYSTRGFTV